MLHHGHTCRLWNNTPLMRRVKDSTECELQVVATNMHLSPEFGMTANEIEADGFRIDARVESLLSADTPSATIKSMGLTQIGLADALAKAAPRSYCDSRRQI